MAAALTALVACATPALLGWFLLAALAAPRRLPWSLRLGLALLLGSGACALLHFELSLASAPSRESLLAVEALALVACWALARHRHRALRSDAVLAGSGDVANVASPLPVAARGVVLVALLLAAATFVVATLKTPIAGGDALAMWNLRPRFLVRAPGEWDLLTAPQMAHADYPPLLPLLTARAWLLLGSEHWFAPAAVAALFTFATFAILHGTLLVARGPGSAALGVLALAATPQFTALAATQHADVPVAAFLLGAVAVATVGGRGGLVISGACAGFAAFTKNEGIAALAVLFVATLVRPPVPGSWRLLLLGAALPAIALLQFKVTIAAATDLLPPADPGLAARASDPVRLLAVVKRVAEQLMWFRDWQTVAGNGPVFLALLGLCLGRQRGARFPWLGALAIGGLLCAYAAVFVITPHGLAWHLESALWRLLLQLWPAAIFVVLAWLAPPTPGPLQPWPRWRVSGRRQSNLTT